MKEKLLTKVLTLWDAGCESAQRYYIDRKSDDEARFAAVFAVNDETISRCAKWLANALDEYGYGNYALDGYDDEGFIRSAICEFVKERARDVASSVRSGNVLSEATADPVALFAAEQGCETSFARAQLNAKVFGVAPENAVCESAAWQVETPDGKRHFVRADIGLDDGSPSGYSFMCDHIEEDEHGVEYVVYGVSMWGYGDARELRECIPDIFYNCASEELTITELSHGKALSYKDFKNLDAATPEGRAKLARQAAARSESKQAPQAGKLSL